MTTLKLAGALATLPEDCTELPTTNTPQSWSGNVSALLDEREKTHGNFKYVALVAAELKELMRDSQKWSGMGRNKQEALDMIASKIGRILSGDSECKDHWQDIAGYAQLIARDL